MTDKAKNRNLFQTVLEKIIRSFSQPSKANSKAIQKISNNHKTAFIIKNKENQIIESFLIPEPTRSLLFVSNEDISHRRNPFEMRININIDLGKQNIKTEFEEIKGSLNSEPSMIWIRLPITKNGDLEEKAMYYPTYFDLSPKCKYQYLSWLQNVEQKTNLSYVFL